VSSLQVRPLTPERWPDFVDLFERRGPRGGHRNVPAYGCWCMYWRERNLGHGTPKKRAMGALVRTGREPGLLAYDGREPVGWISVSPRDDYAAILRSPQYRPEKNEEGVWSIVCFVVDKPRQREGIAAALLEGAVEHAQKRSAAILEAYPHLEKTGDYMGHVDLFRANGFRVVRKTKSRAIVRRKLN
jgi:GNAT superfamily N-acetyltransferase